MEHDARSADHLPFAAHLRGEQADARPLGPRPALDVEVTATPTGRDDLKMTNEPAGLSRQAGRRVRPRNRWRSTTVETSPDQEEPNPSTPRAGRSAGPRLCNSTAERWSSAPARRASGVVAWSHTAPVRRGRRTASHGIAKPRFVCAQVCKLLVRWRCASAKATRGPSRRQPGLL